MEFWGSFANHENEMERVSFDTGARARFARLIVLMRRQSCLINRC